MGLVTDTVVYGPDDKPAASLKGVLADFCLRTNWEGQPYRTFIPQTPFPAMPFTSEPETELHPIDTITLHRRVRQKWSDPKTDWEVFSFADQGSLDNFLAWKPGDDDRRAEEARRDQQRAIHAQEMYELAAKIGDRILMAKTWEGAVAALRRSRR